MLERRETEFRRTFGYMMSVTANSAFGRGENAKTFSPLDFFPDHKQQEETPEQSGEQQAEILKAFFSRFKQKPKP